MEYQILYVGMVLWVRNAVFRFLLFCQESVENFNDLMLFFGQNLCSQPFVDMLCLQKCIAPFYGAKLFVHILCSSCCNIRNSSVVCFEAVHCLLFC